MVAVAVAEFDVVAVTTFDLGSAGLESFGKFVVAVVAGVSFVVEFAVVVDDAVVVVVVVAAAAVNCQVH